MSKYHLEPSVATCHWGDFDATLKPVLKIASGDVVTIDTVTGGLVATLRDLYVLPERRRLGIGSALLVTLGGRLEQLGVTRIEAAGVDPALQPFFRARGYAASGVTFTTGR